MRLPLVGFGPPPAGGRLRPLLGRLTGPAPAGCPVDLALTPGFGRLRLALAVAGAPGGTPGLRLPSPRVDDAGRAGAGPGAAPVTVEPVPPAGSPPEETAVPDAAVADAVARVQQGEGEAFGELYDRYADLVYRYVYYRVGNTTLTEDLVSETFLRALRRISSFSWQGRDFGAWLVTIARNLIADHYKSGRYRLELSTGDLLQAGGDRVEDGPEAAVLESLTNAELLNAVRSLGAEQQECIALRFLQGLSVTETAQIMGKNEGAIKALQYRAVRALARQLPVDLR